MNLHRILYTSLTILFALLIAGGPTVSVAQGNKEQAQKQTTKQVKKQVNQQERKVEPKECENNYKNCVDTRKIVTNAIDGVEKGEQWGLITREIADANLWLKKADERIATAKASMDKGECNAEIVTELGTAWRWLVEAGSAAVRASIAQANGYGKKEK
jgi:hypothetical protein